MNEHQDQNLSIWERYPQAYIDKVNAICSRNIKECWYWKTRKHFLMILVREPTKKSIFGNITHISIKQKNRLMLSDKEKLTFMDLLWEDSDEEPSYSQKVEIVRKLINRKDAIAMEVFPNQANLVDQANLYHIWVADKAKFPFIDLEVTEELPKGKEWESTSIQGLDIEYMVRTTGRDIDKVAYFYIRRQDGKELVWREKQMLKNELQYEGMTAIEIISECGIGKPTCLVYLPLNKSLDFGLHLD